MRTRITILLVTAALMLTGCSTVTAASSDTPTTAPKASSQAPATAKTGTRDNPAPIGTTVKVTEMSGADSYTVAVGPVNLNANEAVAAENQFNTPAKDGFQYIMFPVTYTYVGKTTGTPAIDVSIDFVSAAGTTHKALDSMVVVPNALNAVNELYPGATATGNVAIMVPSADIEKGTLVVSDILGSNKFFLKVA